MPRKPKTYDAFTVTDSDQRVRCFYKQGSWWTDRREGKTRLRKKMNVTARSAAATIAVQTCRELALRSLSGVTPDTLTLGAVFAAYKEHKGNSLEGQWKRQAEAHALAFLNAWGATQLVSAISQTHVDSYCRNRRAAFRELREGKQELRNGALECDFRWLSSVFNWAKRHKPAGKRLLDYNPLHDTKRPKERNVRRPVASHERYLRTLEKADTVDRCGRLRLALAFARFTGRRIDAILKVKASDVLLSEEAVRNALAAEGMNEGEAEHMVNGAVRWRAESDKMGTLHIAPISEAMREEIDRYLSAHPRVGDLPLMPADRDSSISIRRFTATKWLLKAERLGKLPKIGGGLWHPYRRLWATERQNLSDVAVAAGGGWKSTKTLKVYQQVDTASVFAAIANAG